MIATSSFLEGIPVQDLTKASTALDTYQIIGTTPQFFQRVPAKVSLIALQQTEVFRLTTANGIEVVLTAEQQIVVMNGGTSTASQAMSNLVAIMLPNGTFRWERIASLTNIGVRSVSKLDVPNFYCAAFNQTQGYVLCSGSA